MKQKSWISIVFSFASQCWGKIALSVIYPIGVFTRLSRSLSVAHL